MSKKKKRYKAAAPQMDVTPKPPAVKGHWVGLVTIILLGFLIYSNSLRGEFQFDDWHYIVNNPTIKDVGNFQLFDRLSTSLRVRYVAFLTFALNHHFHQLDTFGYHLVNLLIHLINGMLVYWLALLALNTPKMNVRGPVPRPPSEGGWGQPPLHEHHGSAALFAALIFLAHPLQTEGVTYVAQRFTSLAALFYLLSVCCYMQGRLSQIRNSTLFFIASICAGVLGMFTKQITITLPVTILLCEFTFFERHNKRGSVFWVVSIIFLLAALFIPSIYSFKFSNIFFTESASHSHFGDILTGKTYFLTQGRVVATYIRLLFFPLNLNLDYDFPMSQSLLEPKTLACFVLLFSIVAAAVFLFPKRRLMAFGILWFFICLSVESSFITIAHVIFEHRVYLPMAGFALFLSAAIFELIPVGNGLPARGGSAFGGKPFPTRIFVIFIIITIYATLTYQRNKVWQTEIALWSDVVKKSPRKYRGYYTLGMAYGKTGDREKMVDLFKKGLELEPVNPKVYNNLGIAYSKINVTEAIGYFEKAVELDPQFTEGYTNLGAMYVQYNDMEGAIRAFRKAAQLNPNYAPAYNNLGVLLMRQGDLKEAKSHFEKAVTLDKTYKDAHINLSQVNKFLAGKK
ncbi:MAG TPA: tetratricopeptide repeat protein [Candidatus Omnitrophota bacterium]|nr:tetratricopeptide repeat protein [Candidatus Omnitrophota bacterium]